MLQYQQQPLLAFQTGAERLDWQEPSVSFKLLTFTCPYKHAIAAAVVQSNKAAATQSQCLCVAPIFFSITILANSCRWWPQLSLLTQ
jgi:hypothetical protein